MSMYLHECMRAVYTGSHACSSARAQNFGNSSKMIEKLGKLFQHKCARILKNIYPCTMARTRKLALPNSSITGWSSSSTGSPHWNLLKIFHLEQTFFELILDARLIKKPTCVKAPLGPKLETETLHAGRDVEGVADNVREVEEDSNGSDKLRTHQL